jgi:radical SAM protein with 4Fe4S-binding SPASM domain
MERVADELCELGCHQVNMTGGEPLLSPHWEGLCKYLKQLGMRVHLVTNGTLLDDAMIERLVRAGVDDLGVSVDGLRDTHNRTRIGPKGHSIAAFDLTFDGIKRALHCLPVGVITQINQDNLAELESLGEFLGSLGVVRWQLQLAIPSGRVQSLDRPYVLAPQQLPALADLIAQARAHKRFPPIEVTDTIGYCSKQEIEIRSRTTPTMWLGCNAGVRLVSIGCAGKVRGCSGLPAEFDAGSLHNESLADIWQDSKRFSYVTHFNPELLTGGCGCCALGKLCRAGCPALSYYTTGTIYENRHCLRLLEDAAHGGSETL